MATLLRIDSSPMSEASVSRQLTEEFVKSWLEQNPGGKVITRDLTQTELKPLNSDWIAAAYTPDESRTPEQKEILALSEKLTAELDAADEYVIGLPMHNFSIPSTAKLWIDLVARVGKTFVYAERRPQGLLQGKKATFVVASGGKYDAGTALAAFNFVEPYVRTVFAFMGVRDVTFINAGGTSAIRSGRVDRAEFLQPYVDAVAQQASHS